jgi:flagellar biosynthesis protein FliQ
VAPKNKEQKKRDREKTMGPDQMVAILRQTLETALTMGAPLLLIATAVGLLVNVAQVLTSLQETTISTVPRLFAVAGATLLLMPWMTHRLTAFTLRVFSDFHPFVR